MRSDGTIRIIRDTDGIAHVRAATLLDALRGQGWAAAEDRSWQMELDRRRALGRLAEAVGPAGVAADLLHRRLGLAEHAQRSFDSLAPATQDALVAYAEGVNGWLDSGPDLPAELTLLGIEPEPWEPWHGIALYEVRHLAMGTFESKVWRSGLVRSLGAGSVARLWPEVTEAFVDPDAPEQRVAIDAAAAMFEAAAAVASVGGTGDQASNNLVLGPGRTATGRPILAGDPHRAIDLPNVYWQNHVTAEDGSIDAIGLSFPGVPGFPHFGHNADVAWCITHGMADDQDVFVVDLRRSADGIEARTATGWAAATVDEIRVDVAGADPVVAERIVTDAGPVVAGDPSDAEGWSALTLRWTATDDVDTTFDALLPMTAATSADELDRALAPWVVPVNNLLLADVHGTVGYRMRGRLAIRGADNGWTAVPADDPARAWLGYVPDADLPRWRDPECGFLVTANQRIAPDGPYVSHDFAHPTRSRRLGERLATGPAGTEAPWAVDDVVALLGDTHSRIAGILADRLAGLAPGHPTEAKALRLLDGWNQHMDADSAAAALVGTVRAHLVALLVHDRELWDDRLPGIAGPSLHTTLRFLNARLGFLLDAGTVPDEILAPALRLAVRDLEIAQGSDATAWRWGAAHRAMFVHPLHALRPDLVDALPVPPAVELGGDNECVWATSTAPPTTLASNGQVSRYVFDVGDWDASVWVVPHGVSGDARSPHHLDQLGAWAGGGMRPMRFSPAAVDAATESVTDIA